MGLGKMGPRIREDNGSGGWFANRPYGLPGGGAVEWEGAGLKHMPLPNLWGMGLGKMGPRIPTRDSPYGGRDAPTE